MEKRNILEIIWKCAIPHLASWCFEDHSANPQDAISHLANDPSIHKVVALGGNGHGPYLILPRKGEGIQAGNICRGYGFSQASLLKAEAYLHDFPQRHPEHVPGVVGYLYASIL